LELANKKTARGKAVVRRSVLDVLGGVERHLVLTASGYCCSHTSTSANIKIAAEPT
jgi:hypothetical protein